MRAQPRSYSPDEDEIRTKRKLYTIEHYFNRGWGIRAKVVDDSPSW
jgi:hypothetical protein